jgi:signal peptidase II
VALESNLAQHDGTLRGRLGRDVPFFGVVALVFVADQALKAVISGSLSPGDFWPNAGWPLRITYTTNTGAAFGILQGQGFFLVISTLIGLGAIAAYYLYPPFDHGVLRFALSLMLGGALGNLFDRLRQGYVVDFINSHGWWPTFNLADSAITIGIAILVGFLLLRREPPKQPLEDAAEPPPVP